MTSLYFIYIKRILIIMFPNSLITILIILCFDKFIYTHILHSHIWLFSGSNIGLHGSKYIASTTFPAILMIDLISETSTDLYKMRRISSCAYKLLSFCNVLLSHFLDFTLKAKTLLYGEATSYNIKILDDYPRWVST